MSGYQYSGNNPIMYNDPLGNIRKVFDPAPSGPSSFGSETEADLLSASGGGNLFNEGFGGIPLASGGNSNYVTGTGLSAGQVRFISDAYNAGPITDNYYLDHSGTYHISEELAFIMGASYLNRFNAWGTNGFSPSFDAAVYAYDMSANRIGTARTISGTAYNFTPPVAGNYSFAYNAADGDGNSLEINGVSGVGELPVVYIYSNGNETDWDKYDKGIAATGLTIDGQQAIIGLARQGAKDVPEWIGIGSKGLGVVGAIIGGGSALKNIITHHGGTLRDWGNLGAGAISLGIVLSPEGAVAESVSVLWGFASAGLDGFNIYLDSKAEKK